MSIPSATELGVVESGQQVKLTLAEQASLSQFIEKTYKKACAVSLQRCAKDTHLAEDALQDAYYVLMRKWRTEVQHLDPGHQEGWFFTTLATIIMALYRKRRDRRDLPTGDVADVKGSIRDRSGSHHPGIDEIVADCSIYDQVLTLARTGLKDEEFGVLVMTEILDFKRVEIARDLNIPAGTVRSHLSRALAKLEQMPELQRLLDDFEEGRP